MKLFGHIESGFYRALKAWKGVLLTWIAYFILISAISIPLKGAVSAAFGRSMIVENLSNGIDPEIFVDLGTTFKSIMSSLSQGIIYVLITGIILNAFLTGGLFNSVRKQGDSFSGSDFFRACASHFWTFLLITITISLILLILAALLISISALILQSSETMSELSALITGLVATGLFFILLPLFLLSADYARAWISANGKSSFIKAVGMGFRLTFKKFWASYLLMVIMIIFQSLLVILVLKIEPGWHPSTPLTLIVLFLVTQFFAFSRLFLRTWRYAGVTSILEDNQHGLYAELQ